MGTHCRVHPTLALIVVLMAFSRVSGSADIPYLEQETVAVPANGLEVFTEHPLDADAYYTATLSGVVPIVCKPASWFSSARACNADALYAEDGHLNFTVPHDCLHLSVAAHLVSENRARHTYTFFELRGDGKLLSFSLTCPLDVPSGRALTAIVTRSAPTVGARLFGEGTLPAFIAGRYLDSGPAGYAVLALSLVLIAFIPSCLALHRWLLRLEAERQAQAERMKQEEQAREEEREREADEAWLAQMSARYEQLPQDEDVTFLTAMAERIVEDPNRRDKIITDWYMRRKQVVDEVLELHANRRRIELLRERAPHIYKRALVSSRVLERVERSAALPTAQSTPIRSTSMSEAELAARRTPEPVTPEAADTTPSPTKRKLTIEAYREALVQRVRVAAEDQIVLERTRFQILEQARQELGAQGMPEDELPGVLQGIDGAIREALAGKKGGSDGLPQL